MKKVYFAPAIEVYAVCDTVMGNVSNTPGDGGLAKEDFANTEWESAE